MTDEFEDVVETIIMLARVNEPFAPELLPSVLAAIDRYADQRNARLRADLQREIEAHERTRAELAHLRLELVAAESERDGLRAHARLEALRAANSTPDPSEDES